MRNLLLLVCLVGLVGSALAGPVPPGPGKPRPKPWGSDYVPRNFMGRVEYIDQEQMILKPEGYFRIESLRVNPDGTREEFYYEQDNSQPAKLFKFADRMLMIDGVLLPPNRRRQVHINRTEHRISDVLIGDRVYVSFGIKNGETFCSDLTIMRRPGGRVPDTLGDDDPSYKLKISTERNAQQFIEETLASKWALPLAAALRR
jgi:hypothetical protein